MNNEGSVTEASDGGILISIFPAGLAQDEEVLVSVRGRRVSVGQGDKAMAMFDLPEGHDTAEVLEAYHATTDITVVEASEFGWVEHWVVRKV